MELVDKNIPKELEGALNNFLSLVNHFDKATQNKIRRLISKALDLKNLSQKEVLDYFADLYNFINKSNVKRISSQQLKDMLNILQIDSSFNEGLLTQLMHNHVIDQHYAEHLAKTLMEFFAGIMENVVIFFETIGNDSEARDLKADAQDMLSENFYNKSLSEQVLFLRFLKAFVKYIKESLYKQIPKKYRSSIPNFRNNIEKLDYMMQLIDSLANKQNNVGRINTLSKVLSTYISVKSWTESTAFVYLQELTKTKNDKDNILTDKKVMREFEDMLQASNVFRSNVSHVTSFIKERLSSDLNGSEREAVKVFCEKEVANRTMVALMRKVVERRTK